MCPLQRKGEARVAGQFWRRCIVVPQAPASSFKPAYPWHLDIHQDNIGLQFPDKPHCFFLAAGISNDYQSWGISQLASSTRSYQPVIVYDNNSNHFSLLPWGSVIKDRPDAQGMEVSRRRVFT